MTKRFKYSTEINIILKGKLNIEYDNDSQRGIFKQAKKDI